MLNSHWGHFTPLIWHKKRILLHKATDFCIIINVTHENVDVTVSRKGSEHHTFALDTKYPKAEKTTFENCYKNIRFSSTPFETVQLSRIGNTENRKANMMFLCFGCIILAWQWTDYSSNHKTNMGSFQRHIFVSISIPLKIVGNTLSTNE